jgi:hypothetical protein
LVVGGPYRFLNAAAKGRRRNSNPNLKQDKTIFRCEKPTFLGRSGEGR